MHIKNDSHSGAVLNEDELSVSVIRLFDYSIMSIRTGTLILPISE